MGTSIQSEKIKRIVVRGTNWVGDAVMTVPALRALRRALPGAHLTLATRRWAVGVFDGADFLDDILVIEDDGAAGLLRQAHAWRERRFDLAVLFPNAFAPALVSALARVPRRAGYATGARGILLTDAFSVPSWRGDRHEVFYYLNLVAEIERLMDGDTDASRREPDAGLAVSENRRRAASEMLRARGLNDRAAIVALCPGSTNSRAKRWPAERFAALADLLVEETRAQVVVIGSREEVETARAVASSARYPVLDLTGRTELAETVALLSVCDLLVTNDTGPAHIADAVGCPVVVIFGPTDPVTTRPFSERAAVVRRPPRCAPCMLRDCPIDHRCMTAVSPRDVLTEATRMLAERKFPAGAAR